MEDRSRMMLGACLGAACGAAAAYLFFTDRGRWLRNRIEPAVDDLRREFETVWTVDPRVVRLAAITCAEQVRAALPDAVDGLDSILSEPAAEPSADVRRADELFHRVLGYLDDLR